MNPIGGLSPRFGTLTIEKGKPVPFVLSGDYKHKRTQIKREFKAVGQIFDNWLKERAPEIDKITKGRNIKLKMMSYEEYNKAYKSQLNPKEDRTVGGRYGGGYARSEGVGAKIYEVTEDGKELKGNVRWPGNNPDGPFYPTTFDRWAEDYINNPRCMFNRLTKALKMAVSNIGIQNTMTYEDAS